jgi:hypothetical protein
MKPKFHTYKEYGPRFHPLLHAARIEKYVFNKRVGTTGFTWIRIVPVAASCAHGKGMSDSITCREFIRKVKDVKWVKNVVTSKGIHVGIKCK